MADSRSYTMFQNVWFNVVPDIQGCPVPFYLGRGVALTPQYHSLTNVLPPLDGHAVLKICITEGGMFGSTEGGEVPLRPNQAILRLFSERDVWDRYMPTHTGPWEFLGLIFRGEAALTMAQGLIERFGRIMPFPVESTHFRRLEELAQDPSEHFDIAAGDAARLVTDVLMALAEHSEQARSISSGERLVREVVRTIQSRIRDSLNVAELAAIHDISREHLTRTCRQVLNRTPARMIQEEKIGEACRLLRRTRLPIKSVQHQVGYDSSTTFHRAFRQITGSSPSEFRKRGRDLASAHFVDESVDPAAQNNHS